MPGSVSGEPTPARSNVTWRIVRYVDGDSGETLYGVTHRGRRQAWGLKDRAAAERWLAKKRVPIHKQLELDDLPAAS